MRVPAAVYVTLGTAIALGAAATSSTSAQVPTADAQPQVAVPVRNPAGATLTPVSQAPGQPTTAAPVTAVTGSTGVTPIGSTSPTTASSSQAATAADSRGYVGTKFGLTLEGVQIGMLRSVEGGTATSEVVVERVGPDAIPAKHLAGIRYEPITIETDLGSKALIDWIAGSWQGKPLRKSGSIQDLDYSYTVVAEHEFSNALVAETTMPALDAASKDAARVTVKLAPEFTRLKSGSGAKAASSAKSQKLWTPANFRFEMAGLDGSKVNKIDAFTVRQGPVSDAVGESRDYQKEPGTIEFPNLRITLAASGAQTWANWHDDFVVKGNNGAGQERAGAIVYLDPTRTTELGRVNLSNCGIFKLTPEKVAANAEAVRRMVAELYCERMELVGTSAAP